MQLFFINWIAHCFAGKMLLEVVGILSLRNYSWSIGFHIVVLGTHGVLRLFYFVMENACLRQLEFWACANINHLNTSVSVFCDRCKKWQNCCKKIFLARQIKFQNFNGKLGLEVFFSFNLFVCNNLCLCKSVHKKLEKWVCQDRVCFREIENQHNSLET